MTALTLTTSSDFKDEFEGNANYGNVDYMQEGVAIRPDGNHETYDFLGEAIASLIAGDNSAVLFRINGRYYRLARTNG